MKTKIIYISGDEVFNISDIRAAFDAVRNALNLGKDTVLFGVPVDNEDSGVMSNNSDTPTNIEPEITKDVSESIEIETQITEPKIEEPVSEIIDDIELKDTETPIKKRGRPRKSDISDEVPEQITPDSETPENINEPDIHNDTDIAPILSVLSANNYKDDDNEVFDNDDTEIIEESAEINDEPIIDVATDIDENAENIDDSVEPDLEKLLSEMAPLNEDILSDVNEPEITKDSGETPDEENVDATLEQLATEYIQAQDNIATETKNSGRGKIGKLRNILPFKQQKHKDQGLGDLFGWAGVAANDEEFSVPGFFTNVASKK